MKKNNAKRGNQKNNGCNQFQQNNGCQHVQLGDGTFDFVAKVKPRSQSKLIKKLAHGRVSKTKDNAVQLTLKVYSDEGVNIGKALVKEAREAAAAVVELQLKQ